MSTGLKWVEPAGSPARDLRDRSARSRRSGARPAPLVAFDPEGASAGLALVAHHAADAQRAVQGLDQELPQLLGSDIRPGPDGESVRLPPAWTPLPERCRVRLQPLQVAEDPLLEGEEVAGQALLPAVHQRLAAVRHHVVDVLEQDDVPALAGEACRLSISAPWPPGRKRSVPSSCRKGRFSGSTASVSVERCWWEKVTSKRQP